MNQPLTSKLLEATLASDLWDTFLSDKYDYRGLMDFNVFDFYAGVGCTVSFKTSDFHDDIKIKTKWTLGGARCSRAVAEEKMQVKAGI
jgi:hypothetical protein